MDFASRHIGPSPAEQQQMLAALGYASLDELTAAALPAIGLLLALTAVLCLIAVRVFRWDEI